MKQQAITPFDSAKSWRKIIDKAFHLFGNKLFSLRSVNNLLQKTLPSLLKGYQLAVDHQLMKPELDQKLLDAMSTHTHMEFSLDAMLKTMDAIQSECKVLCTAGSTTKPISVTMLIERLLHSTDECISFDASTHLTTDVPEIFLYNAILHFVHFSRSHFKDPNKTIAVYFSKKSEQISRIHFKVTSSDAKANYDYFFHSDFAEFGSAEHPSIEFCRLAFLYMGGDVFYEVHEPYDVEFIIELPAT